MVASRRNIEIHEGSGEVKSFSGFFAMKIFSAMGIHRHQDRYGVSLAQRLFAHGFPAVADSQ